MAEIKPCVFELPDQWEIPVLDIGTVTEYSRDHAWITQDNTLYVANYLANELIAINNFLVESGSNNTHVTRDGNKFIISVDEQDVITLIESADSSIDVTEIAGGYNIEISDDFKSRLTDVELDIQTLTSALENTTERLSNLEDEAVTEILAGENTTVSRNGGSVTINASGGITSVNWSDINEKPFEDVYAVDFTVSNPTAGAGVLALSDEIREKIDNATATTVTSTDSTVSVVGNPQSGYNLSIQEYVEIIQEQGRQLDLANNAITDLTSRVQILEENAITELTSSDGSIIITTVTRK